MTREEKIKAIFSKHTPKEQFDKLWEEIGELCNEIYRYVVLEDECDMLTEVADVLHICLQFLYDYGHTNEELIEELDFKVNRQCKRDGISA